MSPPVCSDESVEIAPHTPSQTLVRAKKPRPVEANPTDQLDSLRQLAADMGAGKVDTLVVIDSNPLYTAPADLGFDERLMNKVRLRVHLGLDHDETAAFW